MFTYRQDPCLHHEQGTTGGMSSEPGYPGSGPGSDGSPLALGTVDHDLDDDDDVIGRATRDVPMQIGSHPRADNIYIITGTSTKGWVRHWGFHIRLIY